MEEMLQPTTPLSVREIERFDVSENGAERSFDETCVEQRINTFVRKLYSNWANEF